MISIANMISDIQEGAIVMDELDLINEESQLSSPLMVDIDSNSSGNSNFKDAVAISDSMLNSNNNPNIDVSIHEVCNKRKRRRKSNKMSKKVRTVKTVFEGKCIIIDDDDDAEDLQKDEDTSNCKESENNTETIVQVFENELLMNEESDNDCVIVTQNSKVPKSKRLRSRRSQADDDLFSRPLNALQIFYRKVKEEIKEKHPGMSGMEQKSIILNSWRHMSDKDKWVFREEARLHRLLFKRENPELTLSREEQRARQVSQQKVVINDPL